MSFHNFPTQLGLFEEFTTNFGTGSINSIFPINSRELFCVTNRNIHRFEKDEIRHSESSMKFSASIIIPETDLVIGITARTNLLYIFRVSNTQQPLIDGFPVEHHGIFHLYFAKNSSCVVLVGYGIKVYHLGIKFPSGKFSIFPPEIEIKFRAKFCNDYNTTILTPPPFDERNEYIFLPTKDGVCSFDLDGNKHGLLSKLPADISTVYCFNKFARNIFTYDADNGLVKWTQFGIVEQTFPTSGKAIYAIIIVDNEHAICLNSSNQIYLLNFLNSRTLGMISLGPKLPSRLIPITIQNQNYIFACFGATLKVIRIDIPWVTWMPYQRNCEFISRYNKMYDTGRILYKTKNGFIKLFSSKTPRLLNVATQKSAVSPVSFLYDRGILQEAKRDNNKYKYTNILLSKELDLTAINNYFNDDNNFLQNGDINQQRVIDRDIIFFTLENGYIVAFSTKDTTCEEIFSIPMKAYFLLIIMYDDHWCYGSISQFGDLLIYDYFSFEFIIKFKVTYNKVISVSYLHFINSIIFVLEDSILIFSLEHKRITDELELKYGSIYASFGDFMKIGYKSGHIITLYFNNFNLLNESFLDFETEYISSDNVGMFVKDDITEFRPHETEITGFSFSEEIWISSSKDGYILAWNYFNESLLKLSTNVPLFSCCFINGYHDILAVTETEIMKIAGKNYFYKFDEKDEIIDNYDENLSFLDYTKVPISNDSLTEIETKEHSSQNEGQTTEISTINFSSNSPLKETRSIYIKTNMSDAKKLEAMMKLNGLSTTVVNSYLNFSPFKVKANDKLTFSNDKTNKKKYKPYDNHQNIFMRTSEKNTTDKKPSNARTPEVDNVVDNTLSKSHNKKKKKIQKKKEPGFNPEKKLKAKINPAIRTKHASKTINKHSSNILKSHGSLESIRSNETDKSSGNTKSGIFKNSKKKSKSSKAYKKNMRISKNSKVITENESYSESFYLQSSETTNDFSSTESINDDNPSKNFNSSQIFNKSKNDIHPVIYNHNNIEKNSIHSADEIPNVLAKTTFLAAENNDNINTIHNYISKNDEISIPNTHQSNCTTDTHFKNKESNNLRISPHNEKIQAVTDKSYEINKNKIEENSLSLHLQDSKEIASKSISKLINLQPNNENIFSDDDVDYNSGNDSFNENDPNQLDISSLITNYDQEFLSSSNSFNEPHQNISPQTAPLDVNVQQIENTSKIIEKNNKEITKSRIQINKLPQTPPSKVNISTQNDNSFNNQTYTTPRKNASPSKVNYIHVKKDNKIQITRKNNKKNPNENTIQEPKQSETKKKAPRKYHKDISSPPVSHIVYLSTSPNKQNDISVKKIDKLELAFLNKNPRFEMRKQSSSIRRKRKSKLILRTVWPPIKTDDKISDAVLCGHNIY